LSQQQFECGKQGAYLVRGDIFRSGTCQLLTAGCLLCWHSTGLSETSAITADPSRLSYLYWFLALLLCLLAGYFMGSRRHSDEENYQATIEKKLSASEQRLKKQQAALAVLTTEQLKDWQSPAEVFREIAKISAQTLEVERVGIWLYSIDNQQLECVDLYIKSKNLHTIAKSLEAVELPEYFKHLTQHRVIAADDIMQHPATIELTRGYAQENKVGALLDGTIWLNNQIVGVICHEHLGSTREWTIDEQNFVGSVADLARLTIETDRRYSAEQALLRQNERLEQEVLARTISLQESEKTFRNMVNSAPISILIIDTEGTILEFNPESEKVTGYSREQVLGNNFIKFLVAKESLKSR
jgi:PAS domain-containing protein